MKETYILVLAGLNVISLIHQPVAYLANTVANPPDNHNNVTWGNPPFGTNILDLTLTGARVSARGVAVPAEQLTFYWTDALDVRGPDGKIPFHKGPDNGEVLLTGPGQNKDNPRFPDSVTYHLVPPNDPKIKDWTATDAAGNQVKGAVFTANKQAFLPLNNLPNIPFQIPQLVGGNGSPNIYIGVDLVKYLMSNPKGIDNGEFVSGETLDELNVKIVNGHIENLAGIVFATSSLEFDPNSPDGFVPSVPGTWLNSDAYQASSGPLEVSGIISSNAPEPGTIVFLGMGLSLLSISRLVSHTKFWLG